MTFTINDDDPIPTVAFSSATYENNESTTSPSLTVNLSAASGRDVVIGYAVNTGDGTATGGGTDYLFTDNAAYTISTGDNGAGGATSITIPFTVINDDLYEPVSYTHLTLPTKA